MRITVARHRRERQSHTFYRTVREPRRRQMAWCEPKAPLSRARDPSRFDGPCPGDVPETRTMR